MSDYSKLVNRLRKYLLPLFVFTLLAIGAYLRFERLSELAYFQLDEEKDAFLVKRILIEHRPILVAAGIPGGINLGPAFIYISSIIMFFSNMNPVGEAFVASLSGVLSIALVYLVAQIFFGKTQAFFSAIFYAFSYLVVLYNRIYFPLVFNPVMSLMTYLFLFFIIKKRRWQLIYPLSLIAILTTQSEASNLSTLLLIVSFFLFSRIPLRRREIILGLTIFFLGQLPLLLFDLRHNFLNTHRILSFFTSPSSGVAPKFSLESLVFLPKTLTRLLLISGPNDLVKQILPCPHLLNLRDDLSFVVMVFAVSIILFFLYATIKKKEFGLVVIASHLAIMIGGIFLYNIFFPGYVHEWFFYIAFPAFCLMTGYSVASLWKVKPTRLAIVLLIFVFVGVNVHLQLTSTNSYGLKRKMEAVRHAAYQVGEGEFYLSSIGSCYNYGGYRYLFWLAGKEPTTSYMDALYGDWVYPLHRGEPPKKGVVLVHESEVQENIFYEQYREEIKKTKKRKKFGPLEVLIVEEPVAN